MISKNYLILGQLPKTQPLVPSRHHLRAPLPEKVRKRLIVHDEISDISFNSKIIRGSLSTLILGRLHGVFMLSACRCEVGIRSGLFCGDKGMNQDTEWFYRIEGRVNMGAEKECKYSLNEDLNRRIV